jgi:hypothetical protein
MGVIHSGIQRSEMLRWTHHRKEKEKSISIMLLGTP